MFFLKKNIFSRKRTLRGKRISWKRKSKACFFLKKGDFFPEAATRLTSHATPNAARPVKGNPQGSLLEAPLQRCNASKKQFIRSSGRDANTSELPAVRPPWDEDSPRAMDGIPVVACWAAAPYLSRSQIGWIRSPSISPAHAYHHQQGPKLHSVSSRARPTRVGYAVSGLRSFARGIGTPTCGARTLPRLAQP